ncbi:MULTISPECIES: hypothetical protein [unclassified Streptococcus]|uniref:hypothetical protein n=1 Tax=unclassified Streptococcus TaxID=2608887 RepID=UPI001071C31E|nr:MULTISPECIES: hypothetical protein [unclassified Streptococcus]MBF0806104.1 hypothetical protein [Streptococcus sp. 19428wA2_WM07]TFU28307.1 hypothetical protein E4T71_04740 [Streptococcus sp. WM07]
MSTLWNAIKQQMTDFLEAGDAKDKTHKQLADIQSQLQRAQNQKQTVLIIYGKKHVTGTILKMNPDQNQLIINSLPHKVSTIIPLQEIRRVSPVPREIHNSHQH